MENHKTLIERLREGEKIKCIDCGKGVYITSANDISVSHEFNCNSVIRVSPNIIVD